MMIKSQVVTITRSHVAGSWSAHAADGGLGGGDGEDGEGEGGGGEAGGGCIGGVDAALALLRSERNKQSLVQVRVRICVGRKVFRRVRRASLRVIFFGLDRISKC